MSEAARRESPARRTAAEAALVVALFGLAVAVRWWGLPSQVAAMWGDEAQVMGEARKFIDGTYTTPFMIDSLRLSAVYDYLLSFPLRWAGSMDVTVARGFSGVVGGLSVPLLYITTRELGYAPRVALLASVALATTFWDVHWSRLALPNIMPVAAGSLAILLTVLAVRRGSLLLAALAGGALAWAVDAHLTGSPVALALGLWLAVLLVAYTRWWRAPARAAPNTVGSRWPPVTLSSPAPLLDLQNASTRPPFRRLLAVVVVLGVVALAGTWPVLTLYLAPGSALRGHMADRFILSAANRAAFASSHPAVGADPLSIVRYQLRTTALVFTVRGDPEAVFNDPSRPLLDAFSGALLILGLGTTLWQWRRPAVGLVLLWLIVPLVTGTVLTNGLTPWSDTPDTSRSVAAVPAMCLLIALGMESLLAAGAFLGGQFVRRRAAAWPPPWWSRLSLVLTVAVAAVIGMVGVQRYWSFVDTPIHRQAFYTGAHEWAVFLGKQDAVTATVVSPTGFPEEFARLYAPQARLCAGLWGSTWTPCPPARLIIFDFTPGPAQSYHAATGLPVHAVPSNDGIVRFWYATGAHLPDPTVVLAGKR